MSPTGVLGNGDKVFDGLFDGTIYVTQDGESSAGLRVQAAKRTDGMDMGSLLGTTWRVRGT